MEYEKQNSNVNKEYDLNDQSKYNKSLFKFTIFQNVNITKKCLFQAKI